MDASAPPSCTLAFIDLAGFTALTEAHDDAAAADLVDRFEAMTRDALGGTGGRLVKVIGDEVFLAFDDPASALSAVSQLVGACASAPDFPLPRGALHDGPAVARGDDLIGASVNTAARIAALAGPGQILASAAVADTARVQGNRVTSLGPVSLRNVSEPIEVYEIDVGVDFSSLSVDPVCRMALSHSEAAGHLRFRDVEYRFCSLECANAFSAEPESFVTP